MTFGKLFSQFFNAVTFGRQQYDKMIYEVGCFIYESVLRREIGIVFQDFQLLTDRSVYDNLLFVLKATGWKNKTDMDDRIEEVLKEVGMLTCRYRHDL